MNCGSAAMNCSSRDLFGALVATSLGGAIVPAGLSVFSLYSGD